MGFEPMPASTRNILWNRGGGARYTTPSERCVEELSGDQQLDHAPRSGPEVKNREIVPKVKQRSKIEKLCQRWNRGHGNL